MVAGYVHISQFEEPAAVAGASLLEIQKLMYFLQERGQPLGLNYTKARYGRLFTGAHVGKAISRLEELGWVGSDPGLRRPVLRLSHRQPHLS